MTHIVQRIPTHGVNLILLMPTAVRFLTSIVACVLLAACGGELSPYSFLRATIGSIEAARRAFFLPRATLPDRVGCRQIASPMASDVLQSDAHIAYPTNRVLGSLVDTQHAQAAIEALLQAGFVRQDIDILQGEVDLHRPDSTGAEHRFLAQFQRTLIRTLGDEHKHLQHYVEDVRAGRCVIMVLAKERDKRELAADILGNHGAESIEFYGRWSWHSLEPHPAAPADGSLRDPTPGRTYEIDLGGGAHAYGWIQSPGLRSFASPRVLEISPACRSRISNHKC